MTPEAELAEIVAGCTGATIGCIDCKKIFHRNLMKVLDPIRERRQALAQHPDRVRDALAEGAAQGPGGRPGDPRRGQEAHGPLL